MIRRKPKKTEKDDAWTKISSAVISELYAKRLFRRRGLIKSHRKKDVTHALSNGDKRKFSRTFVNGIVHLPHYFLISLNSILSGQWDLSSKSGHDMTRTEGGGNTPYNAREWSIAHVDDIVSMGTSWKSDTQIEPFFGQTFSCLSLTQCPWRLGSLKTPFM